MENNNAFLVNCERIDKKSHFKLIFKFNPLLIAKIKDLPKTDRIWDGAEKAWHLSTKSLYSLITLYEGDKSIFFKFNVEDRAYFISQILKLKENAAEEKNIIKDIEKTNKESLKFKDYLETNAVSLEKRVLEVLRDGLKLYPHQVVGVLFLEKVKNALISLHMGLGKTAVSIAHCELQKYKKVLVVTPNSLKFNYYDEVEKFSYSKPHILASKKNVNSLENSKYIILNYDFFRNAEFEDVKSKFEKLSVNLKDYDAIVFDESHKLKNTKNNTYKNVKKTIKLIKPISKVFLSGTPAPNKAYELYSVLHEIAPIEFATKKDFYGLCGMHYDIHTGMWETDLNTAKFEEIFHKLSPHVYRKKKDEVLKDLPDKIYQKISIEMNEQQFKDYLNVEKDVVIDFYGESLTLEQNPLTKLIKLRQFTSKLKVEQISDIIETLIEQGEKVVVVDLFKESLYSFYEKFKNVAVIHTGDQSVEERNEAKVKFQDPNSGAYLFLGSIQTCNYGLTLTAASKMFVMTLPYSVGEYDQVSDRCHRIGQKNTVFIYSPTVRDSIDEMVFDVVESKRKEIDIVIDNQKYESKVTESFASELLKKFREKHLNKK